nr:unnamed protein product [Callosobruchus chinensis]
MLYSLTNLHCNQDA